MINMGSIRGVLSKTGGGGGLGRVIYFAYTIEYYVPSASTSKSYRFNVRSFLLCSFFCFLMWGFPLGFALF